MLVSWGGLSLSTGFKVTLKLVEAGGYLVFLRGDFVGTLDPGLELGLSCRSNGQRTPSSPATPTPDPGPIPVPIQEKVVDPLEDEKDDDEG